MSEWQPIETCPRGTYVLMCAGPPEALGPGFLEWKYRLGGMGGLGVTHGILFDWPWGFRPTHWMPLPEPPTPDKSNV